jgi:tetratricopeptide (TPR) repeat protein
MKTPCPLCQERKAQRLCILHNKTNICSLCCTKIRSETCSGCSYYTEAQHYKTHRRQAAVLSSGHFTVELNPNVYKAVNTALELGECGKINEARIIFNDLLNEYPNNHQVFYGMGTLHAISGNLKESISWFDKAISIFPYFVDAYFNKAIAHMKLFDINNAVHAYRNVIKFGDRTDITFKKAQSFLEEMSASVQQHNNIDLETYIKAQADFDHAFKLMEQKDQSAPTHGNMGLCLTQLGHKAEALAAFDQALEIDPGYLPAKTNRICAEKMEEGIPNTATHIVQVEFNKERLQIGFDKEQYLESLTNTRHG